MIVNFSTLLFLQQIAKYIEQIFQLKKKLWIMHLLGSH